MPCSHGRTRGASAVAGDGVRGTDVSRTSADCRSPEQILGAGGEVRAIAGSRSGVSIDAAPAPLPLVGGSGRRCGAGSWTDGRGPAGPGAEADGSAGGNPRRGTGTTSARAAVASGTAHRGSAGAAIDKPANKPFAGMGRADQRTLCLAMERCGWSSPLRRVADGRQAGVCIRAARAGWYQAVVVRSLAVLGEHGWAPEQLEEAFFVWLRNRKRLRSLLRPISAHSRRSLGCWSA